MKKDDLVVKLGYLVTLKNRRGNDENEIYVIGYIYSDSLVYQCATLDDKFAGYLTIGDIRSSRKPTKLEKRIYGL